MTNAVEIENLTPGATQVLFHAGEYVRRHDWPFDSGTSIWAGLAKEPTGVGGNILRQLYENVGLTKEQFLDKVLPILRTAKQEEVSINQVLGCAKQAADNLGHNYIGTEHLLLGLLETQSAQILFDNFGINKEYVLAELSTILGFHIPGATRPAYGAAIIRIKEIVESNNPADAIKLIKEIVNRIPY